MGASGEVKGKFTSQLCKFFGDISYPIYIIHYPMIYIFTAWVVDNKVPMQEAWPQALLLIVSAFAVAYGSLKLYDIPVRKWLAEKFIKKEMK
jgi:peptidoglycan/LPS O-acetylase OafA/YrhL